VLGAKKWFSPIDRTVSELARNTVYAALDALCRVFGRFLAIGGLPVRVGRHLSPPQLVNKAF
jgi:hypothetical protein